MTITIAGIDFDYRDYDERSNVLYLHVGSPMTPPAKTLETPEGHTVEYDDHGAIIGLELMGVRNARPQRRAPTHMAAGASGGKCASSSARCLTDRPALRSPAGLSRSG
jgi:uncharacterized protein YuzE